MSGMSIEIRLYMLEFSRYPKWFGTISNDKENAELI